MEVLAEIGERAKAARLKENLTRKTLADRSGVTEASIKRFETTGHISLISLIHILMTLDRIGDLDIVLKERSIPFIRDIGLKKRLRGSK